MAKETTSETNEGGQVKSEDVKNLIKTLWALNDALKDTVFYLGRFCEAVELLSRQRQA